MKGPRGVFAALFHRVSGSERERIQAVLTTVGLAERGDWKAGALSHGQKQWLEIGMLIAQTLLAGWSMSRPPA